MADILINHLRKKGAEHSSLSLLVNQWGFDEKLIPKALQNVVNLFPHFSRHDESHSKQILLTIERLLGERIELLTATDTWLILESAYWHDIGMVVSRQDFLSAIDTSDFDVFIEEIRSSKNHELQYFASFFDKERASSCFRGAATPVDAVTKYQQLMAEWFRRQHARRSDLIVNLPAEMLGLSSPRTELIPTRLFRILGRICHAHGLSFNSIISPEGLPFKEAGLAQEDCHPRFVASLLRLGDLLDLDDNRFCPVMQQIAGDSRPKISLAHEDKHFGIRHLRIDPQRIEVTAECESIDGYLETFKWFDWLRQEVQDQMAHWQDIVPSRELGLLPTLGTIQCRLSGEIQVIQEGTRPQFSVDGDAAFKLLQGNNLYSDSFACVRELLQNAVDASLLNIWLSEGANSTSEAWKNPDDESVLERLRASMIHVELTESVTRENSTEWTLTITDEGTGICKRDLAFMLSVGGSQKNYSRQAAIKSMPEWMKPSGAFGIGLQSAFLLTEYLSVTTKSILSNESFHLTMYSPTGEKEGLVLIKNLPNDASIKFGTSLEVKLQLDTFASRWIRPTSEDTISFQFISKLDPVLDDKFPFQAAQLADYINDFGKKSLIPIKGVLKLANSETFEFSSATEKNQDSSAWRYCSLPGKELRLRYQTIGATEDAEMTSSFYRGQKFDCRSVTLPYVAIGIDLLSGHAGKWLTASRDKIATPAINDFYDLLVSAMEHFVRIDLEGKYKGLSCEDPELAKLSLFLECMSVGIGAPWNELAQATGGAWLNLRAWNSQERFRDFFEKETWSVGQLSFSRQKPGGCDLYLDFSDRNVFEVIIKEWLKAGTIQIDHLPSSEKEDHFLYKYIFSKSSQPRFTKSALAHRLYEASTRVGGNRRYLLSCEERWEKLVLKPVTVRAAKLFKVTELTPKFILLPFIFYAKRNDIVSVQATDDQIDRLCSWIKPKLVSPLETTEIRTAYTELIEYIDSEIMQNSPFSEHWKTARNDTSD